MSLTVVLDHLNFNIVLLNGCSSEVCAGYYFGNHKLKTTFQYTTVAFNWLPFQLIFFFISCPKKLEPENIFPADFSILWLNAKLKLKLISKHHIIIIITILVASVQDKQTKRKS